MCALQGQFPPTDLDFWVVLDAEKNSCLATKYGSSSICYQKAQTPAESRQDFERLAQFLPKISLKSVKWEGNYQAIVQ